MRYLHKGDRVAVIGDLELRTYTDTKGNPRSAMQVTATDVEFISDKRTNEPGKGQPAPAQQTAFPSAPIIPGASDDLPF